MSLQGNAEGTALKGKINKLTELHGYSAYEIAVINGFSGTEEEWLKSLERGGVKSTVLIGQDENGGNIYEQTFNDGTKAQFIAPKGAKGDKGAKGEDGVGITGATINADGHLVLTLSNGTTIDAGAVSGGGGGGGDDQTALAGIYTPDGTFSNMVYTWDEFVAMGEEELEYDALERSLVAYGYDVVVHDDVTALGYFGCNNIVLPETTVAVGYTDCLYGTLYIKATEPPFLESGDLDDVMYSGNLDIVCEIGCGDAYKSATGWCDYAEYIREGEMPI